ncbi:MAG TPA: hypothetical protein DGQ94_15315 [Pseudomonas sp.]|nr:hypothetical protein [Pseudomonas sp.]
MIIECKEWRAHHDKMLPAELRVSGTITVSHPGIEPVLVLRASQNTSTTVALDLELQDKEGSFPVICDKEVRFVKQRAFETITQVDIFQDGKLIASITDILVTH